jgi:uncharacterized membrane protein YkgB
MDKYCQVLMRVSLALIFIWFGLLKPLGMMIIQLYPGSNEPGKRRRLVK